MDSLLAASVISASAALFGFSAFVLPFRGGGKPTELPSTPARVSRAYDGALGGRSVEDWLVSNSGVNGEIRGGAPALRARARDLERNSDMVRGALRNRRVNIFGHAGIRLQAQLRLENGDPDRERNTRLEADWENWCRKDSCDVLGQSNFNQLMAQIDRRAFVDGAVLVRMVRQRMGRSPVPLALQVIEIDQLDENRNGVEANGNRTIMGVEVNDWGRAVAYHIRPYHPSDLLYRTLHAGKVERVAAAEVICFFRPERPGQVIGASSFASVISLVRHTYKYQEAELLASRGAANYTGTIESDADEVTDYVDAGGRPIEYLAPNQIKRLLPGEKFVPYMPNRPNTAFAEFVRALKRAFGIGVGQSYESSSGDYSQASFASIRQSLISERDNWRVEQADQIELQQQIWEVWLEQALGRVIEIDHYLAHQSNYEGCKWLARGWPWVDPLKDAKAVIELIKANLSSLTRELGAQGLDVEEVMLERANEIKLAAKLGIPLGSDGASTLVVQEVTDNG